MKNSTDNQQKYPKAEDFLDSVHLLNAILNVDKKYTPISIVLERGLFAKKPTIIFCIQKDIAKKQVPLFIDLASHLGIENEAAKELENWIFKPFIDTLNSYNNTYIAIESITNKLKNTNAIDFDYKSGLLIWPQLSANISYLYENERFFQDLDYLLENKLLGNNIENALKELIEKKHLTKETPNSLDQNTIKIKKL